MEQMLNYVKFCILLFLLRQGNLESSVPLHDSGPDVKNICMTLECNRTATETLEYMDVSIDPCDNFYKFSCGNYLKRAIIPNNRSSENIWFTLKKNIRGKLKILIEENISPFAPKPFLLVKTFYQNCLENWIDVSRILKALKTLGGWPVLEGDSWNEENFDWKETVYKFRKMGYSVNYFFKLEIRLAPMNTSWYRILNRFLTQDRRLMLSIDQPSLGISPEDLANGMSDKMVEKYYDHMVNNAVSLGANKSRAERELKESLEFMIQLAKISLPEEDQQNIYMMTVKDLSREFTDMPWKEYFNGILNPYIKVDENEQIIVNAPEYFQQFGKLMQQTPKKTQANYIMWRVIEFISNFLDSNEHDRETRRKKCIVNTFKYLGISVSALYIKRYFNNESKKIAVKMFRSIQQEFNKILKEVDWLDEKTRKRALEKLDSMNALVGYPDELFNDKKLEEFYESLEVTPGDYLQSILNVTIFMDNNSLSRFREPLGEPKWIDYSNVFDPVGINVVSSNNIFFSAGILQGYFFSGHRPQYMNYGALGFVMGHEITHGFCESGCQYDKKGIFVNWWELEATEKFEERAMCLIRQYGSYFAEEVGQNLNGIYTLEEDVADHGGLKAAYLAYQKWADRYGPEPSLPGLNYTPSQLFWISRAHTACAKDGTEILKDIIRTGPYSPEEFRILVPFSNSPEFAEDFQCPVGSKMNPEEKCSIW